MNRLKKSLLVVAIALPAAGYGAFAHKGPLCFADGAATYRIAGADASPDFRVRISGQAQHPDLRMRLVDQPETADFVMVDDLIPSGDACRSSSRTRTVKLDASSPKPDVTVQLFSGDGAADYTLYVRSLRFSPDDAAALLAAMWKAGQRRDLASSQIR